MADLEKQLLRKQAKLNKNKTDYINKFGGLIPPGSSTDLPGGMVDILKGPRKAAIDSINARELELLGKRDEIGLLIQSFEINNESNPPFPKRKAFLIEKRAKLNDKVFGENKYEGSLNDKTAKLVARHNAKIEKFNAELQNIE